MKKTILSLITIAATSQIALASPALRVESEANLDYFAKKSTSYDTNLRAQDVRVKVTAQITQHIKAVLKTQFERMLIEDGVNTSGTAFDIEKFIDEAYIELSMNEKTQTPVAVIIGKQAVAFGQQASRLPMYKDNLMYDLQTVDQVIGITVKLDQKWLSKVLGSLEVSVFENGAGDLRIGNAAGLAVRLSRQLTNKLKATASAVAIAKDDNYVWNDMDKRLSMGFVYDNGKGSWKTYLEGVVFEGHTKYPTASWGTTLGAAKKMGYGEAVIEYSYLNTVSHEIAAAYNIPVGKHLIVSPEVRYQIKDDGTNDTDTRVGVRTKVKFDSESNHQN